MKSKTPWSGIVDAAFFPFLIDSTTVTADEQISS